MAVSTSRYVSFVVFEITFEEPGGVTVPARPQEDAPDGRSRVQVMLDAGSGGMPQIPGTSLAGALREMVRAARGDGADDALFGRLLDSGGGESVDSEASRIWVLGSRLVEGERPVFRSSTKISRHRAAAEANTLRTEQVLPAGTRFEVFLRWDDAEPGEVEEFAGLLARWRPYLGRGVSRGRGRCRAGNVRSGTLRLDDPDDLLRWLTLSGPDLARGVATEPVAGGGGATPPLLSVPVRLDGPWRTGNGEEPAGEGEPVPMFRVHGQPVVPGSGIKGLVRSRAEFILRSTGLDVCDSQQCGTCWPCQVFGHGGGDDPDAVTVGRRAAVRFADATVADPVPAVRTHIAIDRFTGGVLDGALYAMEVLEAGTFTLRIDTFEALERGREAEIRAVARLVMEDLNDGIIGMGGGVARGYGTVKVIFEEGEGLPGLAEARNELARMVDRA